MWIHLVWWSLPIHVGAQQNSLALKITGFFHGGPWPFFFSTTFTETKVFFVRFSIKYFQTIGTWANWQAWISVCDSIVWLVPKCSTRRETPCQTPVRGPDELETSRCRTTWMFRNGDGPCCPWGNRTRKGPWCLEVDGHYCTAVRFGWFRSNWHL